MHTIRALEEIANSKGYDIALMTTFNLDVDFFERYVAGTLYGNGIKKIALFIDAKELNKAINSTWKKSLLMGSRYSVNPVRIDGSFHPKVMLLLGEDRAKLIVASANFTQSGYSTNNEVFDIFVIEPGREENLHIIQSAVDFFKRIYEMTYKLDNEIMEAVDEIAYLKSTNRNTDNSIHFVHSIEEPILKQLNEIVNNVMTVDIAVPFYDNELGAVNEIFETVKPRAVNTYVQNRNSRFNISKAEKNKHINVLPFDSFVEPKSSSFYHGKVLRFVSEDESWILYGSANCTAAALLSTAKDNGNVECCILQQGTRSDFDYFFNNMIRMNPAEDIECDLLDFSSNTESEKYFYKYGKASNSVVEFHIGVVGEYEEAVVSFSGIELKSSFSPEEKAIIAEIPEELVSSDSDIIILQVSGKDCQELKCWITRPSLIEMNRESEGAARGFRYNPDAIGDEYYEDLMSIMSVLAVYTEDKKKNNEITRIIDKANNDEEDYEDAPEGIIGYVIPPRIPTIEEYQEYKIIKKAQQIGHDFIAGYISRQKNKNRKRKMTKGQGGSGTRRQATSTEQRIKRYIRNAVAAMQNEDNLKENTIETYLSHSSIILRVMTDLADSAVKEMFDLKLNAEIRKDLLSGLVKIDDEFDDAHKKAALQMILELHYINQRRLNSIASYDDSDISELLLALNKKIGIRESLEEIITEETADVVGDHLEELFFTEEDIGKVSGIRPSRTEMVQYLNKLFGYKTKNQLYEILYKNFGDGCTIIEGDTFTITARVRLKDYFSGNNIEWVMNEIEKYCKSYNILSKSIAIDLDGINIPETENPAVRLLYKKKIGKVAIERYEYHKIGEPYYEKMGGFL